LIGFKCCIAQAYIAIAPAADAERKIALTLRKLGRENEADEIIRRLDAVTEVIDEA